MRKRISFAILCLVFSLTMPSAFAESGKREMRGVWLATVWGIDWPADRGADTRTAAKQQAQMLRMLDGFEELNLTTVFFQVRGMGDAMYDSRLEPWSAFVSGKRGVSPGWDPLEFVVTECHRRGLECYAWVNPFRWSSGTDYDSEPDRRWKQRRWLLTYGKYTVFNPGIEEVRQHIVNVCRELVEGYEIDGLVFDDYFYPNRIPETEAAGDYVLWQEQAPWMSFGDWRRANVHKTIADVYAMIADTRPELRFGISPAGVTAKSRETAAKWGGTTVSVRADDWQYSEIYSDPLGWLYQHTIDFISPQIYWPSTHPTAPYGPLSKWWSMTANDYGCHFYGSMTLESLAKRDTEAEHSELLGQIELTRDANIDGCPGIVLYSAKFLPKMASELKQRHFSSKTLTPELRRATAVAEETEKPARPHGLKLRNGLLTWQTTHDDATHPASQYSIHPQRYAVYAFPTHLSREDLMAADGDGIDSRWLLRIVYDTELKVSDSRLNYAVTALSGYSIESDAVFLR